MLRFIISLCNIFILVFVALDDRRWIWSSVLISKDFFNVSDTTFLLDIEIGYALYYFFINSIYFIFFFIFNRDSLGVLIFLFILFILFISLYIIFDFLFEVSFEENIKYLFKNFFINSKYDYVQDFVYNSLFIVVFFFIFRVIILFFLITEFKFNVGSLICFDIIDLLICDKLVNFFFLFIDYLFTLPFFNFLFFMFLNFFLIFIYELILYLNKYKDMVCFIYFFTYNIYIFIFF